MTRLTGVRGYWRGIIDMCKCFFYIVCTSSVWRCTLVSLLAAPVHVRWLVDDGFRVVSAQTTRAAHTQIPAYMRVQFTIRTDLTPANEYSIAYSVFVHHSKII